MKANIFLVQWHKFFSVVNLTVKKRFLGTVWRRVNRVLLKGITSTTSQFAHDTYGRTQEMQKTCARHPLVHMACNAHCLKDLGITLLHSDIFTLSSSLILYKLRLVTWPRFSLGDYCFLPRVFLSKVICEGLHCVSVTAVTVFYQQSMQ